MAEHEAKTKVKGVAAKGHPLESSGQVGKVKSIGFFQVSSHSICKGDGGYIF